MYISIESYYLILIKTSRLNKLIREKMYGFHVLKGVKFQNIIVIFCYINFFLI